MATMTQHEVLQEHLYILNNTQEVIPYMRTHKEYLTSIHPKMNMMKVLQEHNRTFINQFKETIFSDDNASKTLRLLTVGPNLNVATCKGYDINNYSFYTKSQDEISSVQNTDVTLEADSEHFSSASDNNLI